MFCQLVFKTGKKKKQKKWCDFWGGGALLSSFLAWIGLVANLRVFGVPTCRNELPSLFFPSPSPRESGTDVNGCSAHIVPTGCGARVGGGWGGSAGLPSFTIRQFFLYRYLPVWYVVVVVVIVDGEPCCWVPAFAVVHEINGIMIYFRPPPCPRFLLCFDLRCSGFLRVCLQKCWV